MSTIGSRTHFTPQDLLALPDAVNYELVDGQLVERNKGMESSRIGARVGYKIARFLDHNPVGLVFGADASYQFFPDAPDKVRKPDVSFVRFGRFPGNKAPEGHSPIPPDLAVEVVSPGDILYDVERKVDEYLAAGVPLVWVVVPASKTIRVYRPDPSPAGRKGTELTVNDTITGEDVLAGFTCAVQSSL
jgi:Uma2 family endonuclease